MDAPSKPDVEFSSLSAARRAAENCTRCPLYKNATQTVFGEGRGAARLMLVGEQPGDREDIEGHPFVGPAGKMLAKGLDAAGIERKAVYLTNAVKHFKNEPRGKRRLHKRPDAGEVEACRWWLDIERELVRPKVIVALGVTALAAVAHRRLTIKSVRDDPIALESGGLLVATVHPSYLLRMPDRDRAAREFDRFAADLARANRLAA